MPKITESINFRNFALPGLMVILLWAAIAYALHSAQREAIERANTEGRNLARGLAEYVGSSIRALDISLQYLRYKWVRDRQSFPAEVELQQQLLGGDSTLPVTVIDKDGRVIYASYAGGVGLDLSDREYFKVHKEHRVDTLYIGAPTRSRLARNLRIFISRPLLVGDGEFAGVLQYGLSPPALERVYDDIQLGDGSVALVRSDGQFIARSHNFDQAMRTPLPPATPGFAPEDPVSGEFQIMSPVDGVDSLIAYRKVRGYPLSTRVRQSVSTVMASYRAQRAIYLIGGAVATVLLLAVALLRASRQRNKARAERFRLQLAAIVRDTNDPIIGVDRDARILSWNRAAERFYGYTADEVLGKPFAMLVPLDRAEEFKALSHRVLQGEHVPHFETVQLAKDGSRADVLFRLSPVKNAQGEGDGMSVIVEDISAQKVAEQAREEHMKRLESLSARLANAQEEERQTLAYELHEEVAQHLAALRIQLFLMKPGSNSEEVEANLKTAVKLAEQTMEQVRSLCMDLRPSGLDDFGLSAALQSYASKQADAAGWTLHMDAPARNERPPKNVERVCFYLAREALENIQEHASATEVWIQLRQSAEELELSVRDNGIGFNSGVRRKESRNENLGLLGMEQRVKQLGGRLEIQSAPGRGAEVRVVLRLAAAAA